MAASQDVDAKQLAAAKQAVVANPLAAAKQAVVANPLVAPKSVVAASPLVVVQNLAAVAPLAAERADATAARRPASVGLDSSDACISPFAAPDARAATAKSTGANGTTTPHSAAILAINVVSGRDRRPIRTPMLLATVDLRRTAATFRPRAT